MKLSVDQFSNSTFSRLLSHLTWPL